MNRILTTTDHRRDFAGLQYVYPVMSRRSAGLSIGINLNINNACNWRCIYCQVPDLVRGKPPTIDLDLLGKELREFLYEILHGTFYSDYGISREQQCIRDIAISGNGEPTSANEFDQVVMLIRDIVNELELPGKIKLVLITNGSMMQRPAVQKGITYLSKMNGEVWFKLDRATAEGIHFINNANISMKNVRNNLEIVTELCPTWIQTCVFGMEKYLPDDDEQNAYIEFLSSILKQGIKIKGVMLYSIARTSMQPEAEELSQLPRDWLCKYADKISQTGIEVKVS